MFWEVLVGTLVRAVMLCTLRPISPVHVTSRAQEEGGRWWQPKDSYLQNSPTEMEGKAGQWWSASAPPFGSACFTEPCSCRALMLQGRVSLAGGFHVPKAGGGGACQKLGLCLLAGIYS